MARSDPGGPRFGPRRRAFVLPVAWGMVATLWAGSAALGSAKDWSRPERTGQPFRWSGRLERGKTLEVKGINGRIRAEAAAGAEAEVTALKRGRRSDPDQVRIEVVEHEHGVTLCAVYPGRGNECTPGNGSNMDLHDNDVSVEFEVRVPAGVRFQARMVNGGIEATGLKSSIEATTVNGGVELSTSEYGEAATVNGSIVAAMGRSDWSGSLTFRTVNGSIDVDLPRSANADVRAETMNGVISSDFPLSVKTGFLTHRLSGTIGRGGRDLRLKTVNGTIQLHDRGSRMDAKRGERSS